MAASDSSCNTAAKLIFACSGGADVGEIADRAARRASRKSCGRMFCLAGIGGRIGGILQAARAAPGVLAIDGCSLDCAKNTLQQAGFNNFAHLQIAECGLEKGKAAVTDENIMKIADKAAEMLES